MLDQLPTELIEQIAYFLENPPGVFLLRLVCRRLNNATSKVFGATWFRATPLWFTARGCWKLATVACQQRVLKEMSENHSIYYEASRDPRYPGLSSSGARFASHCGNIRTLDIGMARPPREIADPLLDHILVLLNELSRCTKIAIEVAGYALESKVQPTLSHAIILMCLILTTPKSLRIRTLGLDLNSIAVNPPQSGSKL